MSKVRIKRRVLDKLMVSGIFVLLVLLLFNLFNVLGINKGIDIKLSDMKEQARPAELEVISIKTSCDDCFSIDILLDALQEADINIIKESSLDASSEAAKNVIEKYGIKTLPAIILLGEVNKAAVQGFEKRGNAAVFESNIPLYVEADTGAIRGRVTLTMITDDSCEECYNVTIHKQILAGFNLAIDEEITTDVSSSEGKKLIKEYDLIKVPTVILSGDVAVYDALTAAWKQVGTVEEDGAYVFRKPSVMNVVYKNISATI